jgi:VanZ family protein
MIRKDQATVVLIATASRKKMQRAAKTCLPAGEAPQRLLLLLASALAIAYTLAPFEFSFPQAQLWSRLREALEITSPDGVIRVVAHFIAFFIFGVLVAAVYERSLERCGFNRFVVGALLFCVSLEFAQIFEESRHARITDLLGNAAGLCLGALGSIRWSRMRAVRVAFQKQTCRYPVQFYSAVFILATTIWCSAALRPVFGGLKRMNWNDNYRLVIGNETDGSRPWLGEIRYIGIYGGALTSQQVLLALGRLNARREVRDFGTMGLLAGYNFTRGRANEISPEGSLNSAGLTLEVPESCEWGGEGGGVLVRHSALMASRNTASDLTRAIVSSGAFSVEAWICPLNKTQKGPARIVSLSDGIWKRNFTLGQEAADGVFRVRNGINGTNGREHELHGKGVVQNVLHHLVAVYDHGVSSIFKDGQPVVPTVDLREPFVYLLLGSGEEGRVVGLALLTLTIALPVGSLSSALGLGRLQHLVAVAATYSVGSLPYVAVCLWVGGPWRVNLLFWLAVALITVYPLSFVYVHRQGLSGDSTAELTEPFGTTAAASRFARNLSEKTTL